MNYYHKVITEGYKEKFRENGQIQIGRQLAPPTLKAFKVNFKRYAIKLSKCGFLAIFIEK